MTDEEIHSALTAVLDGEGATLRQSGSLVDWDDAPPPTERKAASRIADAVLALPALRDVLAAAARDAEKVRRVEELLAKYPAGESVSVWRLRRALDGTS